MCWQYKRVNSQHETSSNDQRNEFELTAIHFQRTGAAGRVRAVSLLLLASFAIPFTAPATAKHSAMSRKVMHRHHFACSLARGRSREPAKPRC